MVSPRDHSCWPWRQRAVKHKSIRRDERATNVADSISFVQTPSCDVQIHFTLHSATYNCIAAAWLQRGPDRPTICQLMATLIVRHSFIAIVIYTSCRRHSYVTPYSYGCALALVVQFSLSRKKSIVSSFLRKTNQICRGLCWKEIITFDNFRSFANLVCDEVLDWKRSVQLNIDQWLGLFTCYT